MPTPTAEQGKAGTSEPLAASSPLPALKWLFGSFGLTAAFYASGFVIEKSYQKLLGVEIIDPANAIYLRSASDFWLAVANTFLSFVDELADRFRSPANRHWTSLLKQQHDTSLSAAAVVVGLGVAVLLLVLGALLLRHARVRARLPAVKASLERWLGRVAVPSPVLKRSLTAIVLGLAVVSIGYFDLPALHMSKFLLKGSESYLHSRNHSLLRDHIYAFERTFWCAHGAQSGCAGETQDATQSLLDSEFLLHFVVTSFLILACIRISARGVGMALNLTLGATVLIMAIGVLAFYGVTERSFAESKEVIVHYQKEDWLEGTLLARDDKKLLLLPKNETKPIEVPADKPGLIKIVGQVPVLSARDINGKTVNAVKVDEKDEVVTGFCLVANRQCRFYASDWKKGQPVAELNSVEIEYSGQITSRLLHGYVVADTDSCLYLFDKSSHEIWELSKSRVTLVEVEGLADVFQGAPRASAQVAPPAPS